MPQPRPTGDEDLDRQIAALLEDLSPVDRRIALESIGSIVALAQSDASRLDRKIANAALKELRTAFEVFAPFRDTRKVTVFGSARTPRDHAEYEVARDLGERMAELGWLVVTGAGPGIMEAGHVGATVAKAIGVHILLPFEAEPNEIIAGDPKLITFKYFFTRKLMFIKEADAFVLLPGGFGTLDETFELLTLMQTGKSDLHPIVMLDAPGGTYWSEFDAYIKNSVLSRGFVDAFDSSLYLVTDSIDAAVEEIERFYRVYHSVRFVDRRLVVRLRKAPSDALIRRLEQDYADIIAGSIERVPASPIEIRDGDVPDLPRLSFKVDRAGAGRLRQLIDTINREVD
jgi:uncharacterized protein (TIGR00730 family)